MLLKGQLHIHSLYSDGENSPREMVHAYKDLGFDFLAVTDHDHLVKPGYREAIAEIESDLIVFYGMELTISTRWGYVHVGRIEGKRETLHVLNHPQDYRLTIEQLMQCLHDVGRVCSLDAMEITHNGFYTPYYDVRDIPLPKIATDDSHSLHGCGRAWIEIPAVRDGDAILRAIREGQARPCFARGRKDDSIMFA